MSVKEKAKSGNGSVSIRKLGKVPKGRPGRISDLPPDEGRFECYRQSREESDTASPEKEAEWRQACAMSAVDVKWEEDRAAELLDLQQESELRIRSGLSVEKEESPASLEAERQRIAERCYAWRIGEEIRLRRIWSENAEDWANGTIKKRRTRMEVNGFKLEDFVLPGSDTDDAALKHAKQWLPVYYEYVRQSPRWLQWARMQHTRKKDAWDDCRSDEFAKLHLHRSLGRAWVDALSSLTPFLGQDIVFTEIPAEQRRVAAESASFACSENLAIDAEFWSLIDGGRPTCPPEAKWAGRQPLRVANQAEATTVGVVNTFDSRTKQLESMEIGKSLNATVEESFPRSLKASKANGEKELEERIQDNLSERNIDDSGAEIIVLRVNWNHTSNSEIGDAMRGLCKDIRPDRWSEFKEESGNRDQSAEKALKLLLYWRLKTAAGKDSAVRTLEESRLKKELGKHLKALNIRREHAKAATWFKDITGDDQPPWWSKSVTN